MASERELVLLASRLEEAVWQEEGMLRSHVSVVAGDGRAVDAEEGQALALEMEAQGQARLGALGRRLRRLGRGEGGEGVHEPIVGLKHEATRLRPSKHSRAGSGVGGLERSHGLDRHAQGLRGHAVCGECVGQLLAVQARNLPPRSAGAPLQLGREDAARVARVVQDDRTPALAEGVHYDEELVVARLDEGVELVCVRTEGRHVRPVRCARLEHSGRVDRLAARKVLVAEDADAVPRVDLDACLVGARGALEGAPVEGDAPIEAVVQGVPELGALEVNGLPRQGRPVERGRGPLAHRHLQRGGGRRGHAHGARAHRLHHRVGFRLGPPGAQGGRRSGEDASHAGRRSHERGGGGLRGGSLGGLVLRRRAARLRDPRGPRPRAAQLGAGVGREDGHLLAARGCHAHRGAIRSKDCAGAPPHRAKTGRRPVCARARRLEGRSLVRRVVGDQRLRVLGREAHDGGRAPAAGRARGRLPGGCGGHGRTCLRDAHDARLAKANPGDLLHLRLVAEVDEPGR
mmetsp:Transcript_26717/g.72096  ORF Transcript_26717/g.72096 Transcript_26717/m.72096 type:complete len:516 (-) Transcript_26717:197-1744(-)